MILIAICIFTAFTNKNYQNLTHRLAFSLDTTTPLTLLALTPPPPPSPHPSTEQSLSRQASYLSTPHTIS